MMETKINTFDSETIFKFKSNRLENIFVDSYWFKIFLKNSKISMKRISKTFCSNQLKESKESNSLKIFNCKLNKVVAQNNLQTIFFCNLNLFQQQKKLLKASISKNGSGLTCTGSIWQIWELSAQHSMEKMILKKDFL